MAISVDPRSEFTPGTVHGSLLELVATGGNKVVSVEMSQLLDVGIYTTRRGVP